ncbi:unnamed protein product [Dovyalis caffra]|uniref:Uncharacterized protein n=1 Tax=Dovyalis caffra TaxID=77055 RepID=A0AAV1RVB6_9ROSI|nr:unnamed protein product [Dovyalis caffra]
MPAPLRSIQETLKPEFSMRHRILYQHQLPPLIPCTSTKCVGGGCSFSDKGVISPILVASSLSQCQCPLKSFCQVPLALKSPPLVWSSPKQTLELLPRCTEKVEEKGRSRETDQSCFLSGHFSNPCWCKGFAGRMLVDLDKIYKRNQKSNHSPSQVGSFKIDLLGVAQSLNGCCV